MDIVKALWKLTEPAVKREYPTHCKICGIPLDNRDATDFRLKGDCFQCAVAEANQRAKKDKDG